MRFLQRLGVSATFLALAALLLSLGTVSAGAQTETILYDFSGGTNGLSPVDALLPDGHGNYFGTTAESSNLQYGPSWGTVFELSPASGGGWTLTTLYTFQGGDDGASPSSTLVMDSAGNLYGETSFGGNGASVYCNGGCGTVFELSSTPKGWSKTILYNFQGNPPGSKIFDGQNPLGGLVFDKDGNLYGVTNAGGESCDITKIGCGSVFELSPSDGGWTEKLIHKFYGPSGYIPEGGLIFDSAGNLYGTTSSGGPQTPACYYGCGTIFKLSPASQGGWTTTLLHSFDGTNGTAPSSTLVWDTKDNLYGTAMLGGASGDGLVFELEPTVGNWKLVPLFQFDGTDGSQPYNSLTFDSSGNLYGTTPIGGTCSAVSDGCGVVFKLTPSGTQWHESTLYNFNGEPDGTQPAGSVTIDDKGNVFGVTALGGTANVGTIYQIAP
jgi:uncharacterized repeat protein (TIGR03803 family)